MGKKKKLMRTASRVGAAGREAGQRDASTECLFCVGQGEYNPFSS